MVTGSASLLYIVSSSLLTLFKPRAKPNQTTPLPLPLQPTVPTSPFPAWVSSFDAHLSFLCSPVFATTTKQRRSKREPKRETKREPFVSAVQKPKPSPKPSPKIKQGRAAKPRRDPPADLAPDDSLPLANLRFLDASEKFYRRHGLHPNQHFAVLVAKYDWVNTLQDHFEWTQRVADVALAVKADSDDLDVVDVVNHLHQAAIALVQHLPVSLRAMQNCPPGVKSLYTTGDNNIHDQVDEFALALLNYGISTVPDCCPDYADRLVNSDHPVPASIGAIVNILHRQDYGKKQTSTITFVFDKDHLNDSEDSSCSSDSSHDSVEY